MSGSVKLNQTLYSSCIMVGIKFKMISDLIFLVCFLVFSHVLNVMHGGVHIK